MTCFNISETRRDRNNTASNWKSALQNYPKTVEKPTYTCNNLFLFFSVIGLIMSQFKLVLLL